MHFFDSLWTATAYVVSLLTLSPVSGPVVDDQAPLLATSHVSTQQIVHHDGVHEEALPGPVFPPPSGRRTGPGSDFKCDYSRMAGWEYCSSADDRGCWLKKRGGDPANPNDRFDVHTNYETRAPTGITRRYSLHLNDDYLNADGMYFDYAKIFNEQYPGPWIQACWGDVCISLPSTILAFAASSVWALLTRATASHC